MTRTDVIGAIEAQCEWDGDCLLWLSGVNSAGHPVMRGLHGEVGQLARRILTEARTGKPIPPGRVVRPTCGSKRCMANGHCKIMTRSEAMASAGTLGTLGGAKKRLSCHLGARKKLTAEAAKQILLSPESGESLAERFGVSRSAVSAVRHGKSWLAVNPMGGLL